MILRRLVTLTVLVLAASACTGTARDGGETTPAPTSTEAHPGVFHRSLTSGGLDRTYRLFVPDADPPADGFPLVLVFHGGLGDGDGAAEMTGFDDEAAARGWLVAYPDGVGRTWNADLCCGPAAREGVDDVGFVGDLIDDIAAAFPVDPARVFATGISNGGLMSYRLACELSDRIAAVAPVAATLVTPCDPTRPVAILHIHGAADQNVPFGGGFGPKGLEPVDWPPVLTGIETWRGVDECYSDTETTSVGGVTTSTWSPCKASTEVELILLRGGGHSWPGGERLSRLLDPPSQLLDATATIADFFEAHPQTGSV